MNKEAEFEIRNDFDRPGSLDGERKQKKNMRKVNFLSKIPTTKNISNIVKGFEDHPYNEMAAT